MSKTKRRRVPSTRAPRGIPRKDLPHPFSLPKELRHPFDAAAACRAAIIMLERPPVLAHIQRPVPVGVLVKAWVLPLALCPGTNAYAEMPPWVRSDVKTRALTLMLQQTGLRRCPSPLPGRPFVRVLRASGREPDKDSGHSKIPVDRLCVGKHKRPKGLGDAAWKRLRPKLPPVELGYLVDDTPSKLDLHIWWEPAPNDEGFVYVELWTGTAGQGGA